LAGETKEKEKHQCFDKKIILGLKSSAMINEGADIFLFITAFPVKPKLFNRVSL